MSESNPAGEAFNDSLNFVKKLWGQMGVPGMSALSGMPGMPAMPPTMSVEDLDKRVQELKTVETWLNVNMQMLRNTIHALEVQRATISTLHSLSTTMANTMNPAAAGHAPGQAANGVNGEDKGGSATPLIAQSTAWWQGVQDQFKQALGTALEKSAANFETVRTASENMTKAATATVAATTHAATPTPRATRTTKKSVGRPRLNKPRTTTKSKSTSARARKSA